MALSSAEPTLLIDEGGVQVPDALWFLLMQGISTSSAATPLGVEISALVKAPLGSKPSPGGAKGYGHCPLHSHGLKRLLVGSFAAHVGFITLTTPVLQLALSWGFAVTLLE